MALGVNMDLGDGKGLVKIVDNDGYHETGLGCAQQSIALTHSSSIPLQVQFYQGRDEHMALILLWRKVDPASNWHDDLDDQNDRCDANGADPLNDIDCGRCDDNLYFDWSHFPSVGNDNWNHLLSRGWSVVPSQNLVLSPGTSNPCSQPTQCYTDTFNQPKNLNAGSVDLLLMTDASLNDDFNRPSVANYLSNFLSQLPQGVDTSVGVMVGYSPNSGKAGLLNHASSVQSVLSTNNLAVSDMEGMLAKNLTYVAADSSCSDNENFPLYSTSEAVGANLQTNQAQGFLRTNAALSVIYLTDGSDE